MTLKPLERKALGALSEVRHLEEGETVYSPGDPAALAELFRSCSVCELKLYRVVDELMLSQHFDLLTALAPHETAA